MSRSRSEPRQLADLPFAGALTRHEGGLAEGALYDTVHFDHASFEDPQASGARFLECAFTQAAVQGGRLRRARFTGAWFRDVRMTLTDIAESQWTDVTFVSGAWAGLQAFGMKMDRAVLSGCKLDSVNFRDAELTGVIFRDCVLREVDFGGAKLSRTAFAGCRLTRVDVSRASLDRVDLRGSELGLTVGPQPLRGAIITSAQLASIAPVLADALGIVVDDG